jgi:Protein of unknown function (DUF2950)
MEDDMRRSTKRENAGLGLIVLVTLVFALTMTVFPAQAPQKQETFKSPGQAVQAMYEAARNNNTDELMRIFGPEAKDVLSSGDPAADAQDRQKIARKYAEMHRLVNDQDTVKLYVGAENWPFPIPLVKKNGVWSFDTAAGKKEVLYRRIGRNEFATLDVLGELVEAQKEYHSVPRDGATVKQYAQKFFSDSGRQNGLYWKTAEGEPASPIGPLVAEASKTYTRAKEGPTPFHGYYYSMLQAQGKSAPGGTMSYMSNGKMIRGFAIVAYPATYRNSGVMTFIVGADGMIYEKDLGPQTASTARSMTLFNPDKTWNLVE